MQIHSLEIQNVKGIKHLKLDDLPNRGVVVIHGNNEAGKSTILEALNTVLFFRYKQNRKETKALRPVHDASVPNVAVEMSIGPYRFFLRKQWFKAAFAHLDIMAPSPEQLSDNDAEKRLKEILDKYLDEDLLRSLFLRQGEEFAAQISAAGIPSLSRALDEHAGVDTGTVQTGTADRDAQAENDALMARVNAEYARYYTDKSGKETGELREADEELVAARAAAEDAESQLRQLDSYVERYTQLEKTLSDAREKLPGAREELQQREADAEKAAAAAQEEKTAAEEYRRAEEELTRARQLHDARSALRGQVEKLVGESETAEEHAAEKARAAEEEEAALAELTKNLEKAKAIHATAREAVRLARRENTRAADREKLRQLESQLQTISDAEKRLIAARDSVAACGRLISDADVTAVVDAANEVRINQKVLDAAAAKLWLSAPSDTEVLVDDERTVVGETPRAVNLREGTALQFGDVLARYAAGEADAGNHSAEQELQEAEGRYAELLAALECDNVEEVRARREKHRQLIAEKETALKDFDSAVGDHDVEELRAEYRALRDKFAEKEDGVEHADLLTAAQDNGQGPQEALAAAEQEEEDAQSEVQKADAALAPRRERPCGREAAVARSSADNARLMLEAKREELRAAEAESSDADLQQRISTARDAAEEARKKRDSAAAAVAEADPEMSAKLQAGALAQLETLQKRIRDAEAETQRLTGYIEQASGAAERREQTVAAKEAAENTYSAVRRRANAAARLREVLLKHRDAARRRYAAPFAEKLSSLAESLLGGKVEFVLKDDLSIAERTRDGVTVPLGELSGGAKEQLAILTRFAIAELVARFVNEEMVSEPVPVVIDDALGSTDPQRLQLMAALFADAGKSSQVLVFTCDPDRYSRVPGRMEIDIESLKTPVS